MLFNNITLRRYSTEEYGLAALQDALRGDGKHRLYNLIENLEALHYRGFKYDPKNDTYVEPKMGVAITANSLWYKGAYKEVDYLLEVHRKKESFPL